MRQSTRVIINSGASFIRQALNMGLRIFLLAFILWRVDSKAFGLYLLAAGLERLVVLMRDAMNKGCLVNVATHLGENDHEKISKVVSSTIMVLVVPAILALIAGALIGGPAARFFEVKEELHSTMAWVFFLAGLDLFLVLPLSPFTSVVEAHQRYGIVAIADTSSRALRAALIVLSFTLLGPNVVFVMAATVIADLVMRVSLMIVAYRLSSGLRIRPRLFDREAVHKLMAFGSFIVYGTLIGMGATEAAKWIIGKFLGVDYVTFLTLAAYSLTVMAVIVQTMTLVLVPVASRYKAQNNKFVLQEMFVRGTRYATLASAAAAAILLPAIGPLLSVWLKPELAWIGPYAMVVGICGAISLPGNCAVQVLNGMGDSRRPFYATLTRGLVIISITFLAVRVFRFGFAGAVIAESAGHLTAWAIRIFLAIRVIGVSRVRFATQAYLQPLLAAVPTFLVGLVLNHYLSPDSWGDLVLIWAILAATFLVFFLPHVSRQEWATVRLALSHAKTVVGGGRKG